MINISNVIGKMINQTKMEEATKYRDAQVYLLLEISFILYDNSRFFYEIY